MIHDIMRLDPATGPIPPSSASGGQKETEGHTNGYAEVQHAIVALCANVIGRPVTKIKPHKSFLSNGGDSLLAINLVSRCHEVGYPISVEDVLRASSIAELCQRCCSTYRSKVEQAMVALCAEVIGRPVAKIRPHKSFLSNGGDSLLAIKLMARCHEVGHSVSVEDILRASSITELCQHALPTGSRHEAADHDNNNDDGSFELSPIQRMYFETMASSGLHVADEDRFNQSVCLVVHQSVDAQHVADALAAIVAKHPMLRARFRATKEGGWKQMITEPESFHMAVHQVGTKAEAPNLMVSAQSRMDLEEGPVFVGHLVSVEADDSRILFMAAHHLVVDVVSWHIITRDLEDHVLLLRSEPTLFEPRATTALPAGGGEGSQAISFRDWTRLQSKRYSGPDALPAVVLPLADADTVCSDWSYWGDAIAPSSNPIGDRTRERFVLGEDDTALLLSHHLPLRTEPIEMLLAALFHSFHRVFPDRPTPTVFNEGHGREPWSETIDLSNTVGWFTTMSPIHVPVLAPEPDIFDVLERTKDARRSIPGHGLPYFSSRFLHPAGRAAFASHANAEVAFNYQGRHIEGQDDSLFLLDDASMGDEPNIGGRIRRLALFVIEAWVWHGRLHVDLHYSKAMPEHRQEQARSWTREYGSSLRLLLGRMTAAAGPRLAPSDVPLMGVTNEELSHLQGEALPTAGIASVADVEEIYPCSPMQQGILVSQAKHETTMAYHSYQIWEFTALQAGSVDVGRLAAAWRHVVGRHSMLRSVLVPYMSTGNAFCQVVLKQWEPPVVRAACESADQVVAAFKRQCLPRYADHEPQHQLALCTTEAGQTFVRFYANHALMDAHSVGLVVRDLVRAYDGTLPGPRAPSYGSYIAFLQSAASSAAGTLSYWTKRLADAQPCRMPGSLSPSASSSSSAPSLRSIKSWLGQDAVDALHRFRDANGVTVANIIQLAWALVLGRYTGSPDVAFGYMSSGRDALIPGVEDIVGPMISMTVSRIRPSGTVAEAARQVQDDFFHDFDNQRTSLGDIHHALGIPEGQTLFNTTMSYVRSTPEDQASLGHGLAVSGFATEDPTEYDVNIHLIGGDSTVRVAVQYSTSFLDDVSARCLLDSLQHALYAIATSDPGALVQDLQLLSHGDVGRLRAWNASVPSPAASGSVPQSIREQALLHPDAAAVCGWDGRLSYAELDSLTDRVAQHLVEQLESLAGPAMAEPIVGLCFEKSIWAVVSMVAVLKAGAVFVPLGSQLPAQRLHALLEDTKAVIVLASASCVSKFARDNDESTSPPATVNVVAVDAAFVARLAAEAPSHHRLSLPVPVHGQRAAVVIYTSGSTGRPKGVVLSHDALHTSLQTHGVRLGFGPATRSLQYSAYVFDVSLIDTFGVLEFGGCVCVPSEDDRMDPVRLGIAMENMGVSLACLTPTVAGLLAPGAVPTLRTLVLLGEALTPAIIETWGHSLDVFNSYGPAECTIGVTVNGPVTDKNQASNIGMPLTATTWVVDPNDFNSLVPIGAAGELLLEGPTMARGYLYDPERTGAAFITDPAFLAAYGFSLAGSGRRMYRTGDIVKQNPADGSLAYVGRRDGQVKIRGQRVEIGEIEYHVGRSLPDAHMVAVHLVVPPGRTAKDAILAVAVELREQSSSSNSSPFAPLTEALRLAFLDVQAALAEQLPHYMVPTLYIPLREMPMTASGKLDRRKLGTVLQTLDDEQMSNYGLADAAGPAHAECETPTESQLRQLWAAALGVAPDRIAGSGAHFFRAGGDSVNAIRLVSQARRTGFCTSLTVADVFRHPVLAGLAAVVDRKREDKLLADARDVYVPFSALVPSMENSVGDDGASAKPLVKILTPLLTVPGTIVDAAPINDFQEASVRGAVGEARHLLLYIHLSRDGVCDVGRWRESCLKLIESYEILRTAFVCHQGRHIQLVLERFAPEIQHFETALPIDEFAQGLIAEDMRQPPRLGCPFTAFAIITSTTESQHRILLRASHATYDAGSMPQLMAILKAAYDGQPIVPYPSFARYMHVLATRDNDEGRRYWSTLLSGATMPAIHSVPPTVNRWCLPYGHVKHEVRVPSRAKGGAITSVIRAAWALALATCTSSRDVVFGEIVSGRNIGSPDTAGCCVNTVPVRAVFADDWTVANLLAALNQQVVARRAHETLGVSETLRECEGAKDFTSAINMLDITRFALGVHFGGHEYAAQVRDSEGAIDGKDVAIATYYDEGHVYVIISYFKGVVEPAVAQRLLTGLCAAIDMIASGSQARTIRDVKEDMDMEIREGKRKDMPWSIDQTVCIR